MKKSALLVLILFRFIFSTTAQTSKFYIFDVSNNDSVNFNLLLQRCNDILFSTPGSTIEVACHENGIYHLLKGDTLLEKSMIRLKAAGNISFIACSNTLNRYDFDKSQLVSFATLVPAAITEIAEKKQQGWEYFRMGGDVWSTVYISNVLTNCIEQAKKGMDETKARSYCRCMISKLEIKYPVMADADRITADDMKTPEFLAMVKDCLGMH